MPAPTPPLRLHEDGALTNWDRYLNLLARKGVPEKMRPWCVRRVEEFLKEVRPDSLSRLTEGEPTGYLERPSSRSNLVDWQFRELVDALQPILVDLAQAPGGKSVGWDYWKSGDRVLVPNYPTLAMSQAPAATVARHANGPTCARSAERFPLLETLMRGPGHDLCPDGAPDARDRDGIDGVRPAAGEGLDLGGFGDSMPIPGQL